jgi:hypothetical protein
MKMVRKQVYITPEQDKKLKECSQRLGVTEAELIRRAVEGLEVGDAASRRDDLDVALDLIEKLTRRRPAAEESLGWSRADMYKGHPRHLDPEAWQEELAFIEERARLLPRGGSTVKWRREDSYDES